MRKMFVIGLLWTALAVAKECPSAEECPPVPCCPPRTPCCWDFNPCDPRGCAGMKCKGRYFTADFLCWRAENHGFSYAYEMRSNSPVENSGRMTRIDPSWAPAFRLGAGWNTGYDFWDVFLGYTWYGNHSKETRTSLFGFIPLWPVSSFAQFRTAFAGSHFVLNMGDLEVGRSIYFTRTVAIRPHCGLKGGTISQKFINHYGTDLSGLNSREDFCGREHYWGLGPRVGASGEWHWNYGLSVLGKIAGALLYGNTNMRMVTQGEFFDNGAMSPFKILTEDQFYQLTPNLQMSIGFQWQRCFYCETVFFKASASWETNYWWNQFHFPIGNFLTTPLPTIGNQPLTMEGVTVNLECDF